MRLISLLFIIVIMASCKDPKPPQPIEGMENGLLVLCEGLYQQSNSSLSWVNLGTDEVVNDFYTIKNGQNLGDTGNDLQKYGGKIYAVLTGSNTIEVLSAKTGLHIKQIVMLNGSAPKSPRSIAFFGSKIFVACQDGFVDVLDTNSLTVQTRIAVGLNPEDLAIANGKLYVSNSGGLNFPNYDSTLSVVSLSSFSEIKKVTVGLNPGKVIADANGEIYVISRGDYSAIPARMHRISTVTDEKVETYSFDALDIIAMNSNFLISFYNYSNQQHTIRLFNPNNEQLIADPFFTANEVQTLYGLNFDSTRDKIYCLDAMNFTNTGYVRQYSSTGIYEKSFHVGLNPNSIVTYD